MRSGLRMEKPNLPQKKPGNLENSQSHRTFLNPLAAQDVRHKTRQKNRIAIFLCLVK